jgi:hypothetical protein
MLVVQICEPVASCKHQKAMQQRDTSGLNEGSWFLMLVAVEVSKCHLSDSG